MSKLAPSIDALFAGDDRISDEMSDKLLDILRNNFALAEQKVYRRFTIILGLWLAGLGVSQGTFTEASFLGVKVTQLSLLLFGLPLVMGILFYGMVAATCGAWNNLHAINRVVKHHWPKVWTNDLVGLFMPPTFFTLESISATTSKGVWSTVATVWMLILVVMLFIIPFAALIHVCYLAVIAAPLPLWLVTLALLATLIVLSRAVTVFIDHVNYTT